MKQELWYVAFVFLIIIVVTAAETLHWLPGGRVKFVIIFASGVAVMALLNIAGIPPQWFSGRSPGFGLAVTLLLTAFVTQGADARAFGVPLFTGLGGALMVINLVALVRRIL